MKHEPVVNRLSQKSGDRERLLNNDDLGSGDGAVVHSPPINVARVRFPDSASYERFFPGYSGFPLSKYFQIQIQSGLLSSTLS